MSSKKMPPGRISSAGPFRRRGFLRGALAGLGGTVVGLPFLESLSIRQASAQDDGIIKRMGVFFACNGVDMTRWFPTGGYGALSAGQLTGTANEPLAPLVSKLLVPRGVHMSPRGYDRDGGGGDDHGKGMAHKLTAQYADDENWLALGPSVDHVIANAVNPGGEGSRRPPLNLMVGKRGGYKGLDYISYRGAGDAVAAINNPWNAYADFMELGGSNTGTPVAAMDNLLTTRRQSVLDVVSEQFDSLKARPLSAADRQKLDSHFTTIREIEQQLTSSVTGCGDDALTERARAYETNGDEDSLSEKESEYPAVTDLHIEIMALALACDASRVATLQFDRGSGGPTFRWDGMNHEYNHHKLSHGKVRDDCFGDSTENGCADVAGFEDMLFDIDRWHQEKYAQLLRKLDSYVEAEGRTVLDNSVIMYTNELADGKAHSFMHLPYILGGSCGGYLKQGQYVLLGDEDHFSDAKAPHNRLLNTLVNAMGIQSDWFGVEQGQGGETMEPGVYEDLLA